jgi:magnesium-transporting ATPase (P-type)
MEALRVKVSALKPMTLLGYTLAFVLFVNIIHEFASNLPYNILCATWITSLSLACILIGQWDTLSRKSFGPLAEIIGQENAMLIIFVVSVAIFFLVPFVVLYKWLLL